jgi:hypothetical protein
MTRRVIRVAGIAALAAAITTGAAGAVTPANGGDVGGTVVTINDGPGDQTEPRVSGNLAVYTDKDFVNGATIHYFVRVSTGFPGTGRVAMRTARTASTNRFGVELASAPRATIDGPGQSRH